MSHAKLTKQQKETIGLLSIGTFLEYFDLMLYIHMAVLLNELFFPQSDPLTTKLVTAFTLVSTFLMRPIGGFVIGWIGDKVGRKPTVIITTFMMACSCFAIANLKTYAEIGLTASVIMIICRMVQGFSSMGEAVGAELYLAEILKAPQRYVYNGIVDITANVGTIIALVIASITISMNFNWRLAFWFGMIVALIGFLARTRMRETPEFVDYKRRMKNRAEQSGQDFEVIASSPIYQEKVDKKAVLAYFLIRLVTSVCFYITYVYMGTFMKDSLKFSAEEIMNQDIRVTIIMICGTIAGIYFLKRYHPIKIAQANTVFFVVFLPFIPWWLENVSGVFSLSCVQFTMFSLVSCLIFVEVACFKHFSITRRFTLLATTFGVASVIGDAIVAFSLIPLEMYLGHYSLWVIYIPTIVGFLWAINYIKKLEIKKGLYHNYPEEDFTEPDTAPKEEDFEYDLDEEYQSSNLSCEYADKLLNRLKELNLESKKKINIRLVEKAIIFAKYWHGSQRRKTGELFYSHPLAAAATLAEQYFKTDVIVAMILHDVIEDTDCHLALIEKTFNWRVAQIVDRMTKIRLDDSGHMYKQKLGEVVTLLYEMNDNEALFAKQHDRLHNLRTIAGMSPEKQKKTAEETIANLIPFVAAAAEKLNIGHKMELEKSLFITSRTILGKKLSPLKKLMGLT